MSSLFRIARALGVTQGLAAGRRQHRRRRRTGAVLRHDEGVTCPATGGRRGPPTAGRARPVHPDRVRNPSSTFEHFFEHDGSEFVYIAEGVLDVELGDGRLFTLAAGECLRYPGSIPHRWRSGCPGPVRVLMIHTEVPGGHRRRPAGALTAPPHAHQRRSAAAGLRPTAAADPPTSHQREGTTMPNNAGPASSAHRQHGPSTARSRSSTAAGDLG